MKDELTKFLLQFPALKQEELESLSEDLITKTFQKGTVLLKAGAIPRNCYFVLKGCIREYIIVDGVEKTTAFFTEAYGAVSSKCYSEQTPANSNLVCIEDVVLMVGDPIQDQKMFAKYPFLMSIVTKMMEKGWEKTKEDFASFIISSPKERYLNILKNRPELVHRVPQHQLASYLGVTPESLSRIRKRISIKP